MSIQNLQLSGASDGAGFGRAVSRTAEFRLLVNQHIQRRLGAGDNHGAIKKKVKHHPKMAYLWLTEYDEWLLHGLLHWFMFKRLGDWKT
jgi:hypothetical protein